MLPEVERKGVLKDRDKLCFACPASYPASYSSCPRCQLPLVFPIIGRTWVVEGLLGRGGMGAVFAAHHISAPPRKAAVKVLVPVPGEQMADRRDRIGRFHREALALRRLVHDNIVQLYDFARERDGSLYLAMERLEGPTLSALVKQGGPQPAGRAVELILPVLSAVGAAHKVGVIHRDLKPDNIVLATLGMGASRKQVIKVVDFGVARLAGDTFTRTGQALGTPVYMPPEQANGTDIDERVDIYGAGAVFYELLSGRPPFCAPDAPNANLAVLAMVVTSEPRSPREVLPQAGISPALDAVVMRAMRRNREERFSSVDDFAAAIQEALRHPEAVPWTPPLPPLPVAPPAPLLPSLAHDSLPGSGGVLSHGVQLGLRPAYGHAIEVPPQTGEAPLTGRVMAPPGLSLRLKVLIAGVYLLLVGFIAVSLVLDRLRPAPQPEPGAPLVAGAVPSTGPDGTPAPGAATAPGAAPAGEAHPALPGEGGGAKAQSPLIECPEGAVAIPAGCFTMGSDEPAADEDERPAHPVCLSHPFCLDRHEVDNAAYRACVAGGRCRPAGHDFRPLRAADFTAPRQPVVLVTWQDADAYCRAQGQRLPTEAEWEYAARGTAGRRYPWGDEEPGCESAAIGAYALPCGEPWCRGASQCVGRNPSHPLPGGSRAHDRSPFGVMDMGGNVAEWVADWYEPAYYRASPRHDPSGPAAGSERVYRGGSWGLMGSYLRATYRNHMPPGSGDIGLGFRCAK